MYERNDNLDTLGSSLVAQAGPEQERLVRALYGVPSAGFAPDLGYTWRYAFKRPGSHPVTFYDNDGYCRIGSTDRQAGLAFLSWLNDLVGAEFLTRSPEGEIWSGDAADLAAASPEYADLVRSCESGMTITTITGFKVYRPSRKEAVCQQ
jgi:hypothetical protein